MRLFYISCSLLSLTMFVLQACLSDIDNATISLLLGFF